MNWKLTYRSHNVISALALGLGILLTPGLAKAQQTNDQQTATGIIFHDTDGNGQRDDGEPGLADIKISNGTEIVMTHNNGRYEIPVSNDCSRVVNE